MPETSQKSPSGNNFWPILAVVLFVATIQGAWWMIGDQITTHGGFADGDSYTRLLRIERLIETLDWFDITIPDANAPFGTTVHWTRPFDILLLLISAPLIPFLGFSKALFWAGTLVSPLLHILSAAILVWAMTPLIGRTAACFAGALSAAQIGVMVFGIVGRADHHMMFVLIIALSSGFLIRSLVWEDRPRYSGLMTGLTIAFGIWIGPEFQLYMAICLTVMGFHWFLTPTAHNLEINRYAAIGLCTGLIVALVIERGIMGFPAIEYDRISIIHLSLGVAVLAFWTSVMALNSTVNGLSIMMRAVFCLCGLGICFIVMLALFPKIIGNPLNDAVPAIQPIYTHISEYKPITDLGRFLIYYGSALFAFPWIIWRLKQSVQQPQFWGWIFVLVCLVIYVTLGVNWIRWCLYAGLFLSIVIGDAIFKLDGTIGRHFGFPKRLFLKLSLLPALATGPMILGAIIIYTDKTPEQRQADQQLSCPIIDLATYLNDNPLNTESQIVVASANFGPEIMYRTNHRVLATVHHRNVQGILDGHTIMQSVDDRSALKVVTDRGVTLLLLCPGSGDDKYFLTDSKPGALYSRLLSGHHPDWVKPVLLPENLDKKFNLYRINESFLSN